MAVKVANYLRKEEYIMDMSWALTPEWEKDYYSQNNNCVLENLKDFRIILNGIKYNLYTTDAIHEKYIAILNT